MGQPAKNVLCSMFRDENIAVFQMKTFRIDIEKDKNTTIFQTLPLLLNYCQTIDRLRGLEG